MIIKDHAICIRAVDYSETSQILTFFTRENGKIAAIAKGAKRLKSKFEGAIEVFSYGEIVFSEGGERTNIATLTEFEQKKPLGIGKNLFSMNCAAVAAELVNVMTEEGDKHEGLYDYLLEFLKNAGEAESKGVILAGLIFFQLFMLKEVGMQPNLGKCGNCKRTPAAGTAVYFSSAGNGVICRDCEGSFSDKIRLSGGAAKCFMELKLAAQANEDTLFEMERILLKHFRNILGRELKTARYVVNI